MSRRLLDESFDCFYCVGIRNAAVLIQATLGIGLVVEFTLELWGWGFTGILVGSQLYRILWMIFINIEYWRLSHKIEKHCDKLEQ